MRGEAGSERPRRVLLHRVCRQGLACNAMRHRQRATTGISSTRLRSSEALLGGPPALLSRLAGASPLLHSRPAKASSGPGPLWSAARAIPFSRPRSARERALHPSRWLSARLGLQRVCSRQLCAVPTRRWADGAGSRSSCSLSRAEARVSWGEVRWTCLGERRGCDVLDQHEREALRAWLRRRRVRARTYVVQQIWPWLSRADSQHPRDRRGGVRHPGRVLRL